MEGRRKLNPAKIYSLGLKKVAPIRNINAILNLETNKYTITLQTEIGADPNHPNIQELKAKIINDGYEVEVFEDIAIKHSMGTKLMINSNENTLGCAVQLEVNGKTQKFLVTCGHGANLHETVKTNDGQIVGKVEQVHYNETTDIALIKIATNNTFVPSNKDKEFSNINWRCKCW